jgi:hypothetical protein
LVDGLYSEEEGDDDLAQWTQNFMNNCNVQLPMDRDDGTTENGDPKIPQLSPRRIVDT